MTEREQQSRFARMAAELILHALSIGYEVTIGGGDFKTADGNHYSLGEG